MPVPSLPAQTAPAESRTEQWASCPTCWGQRRIWEHVQTRNGEGAVLVATACPACLGIGEVLR
jgi:hypothetical protein